MERRRLLLISNSTSHGSSYLDHCSGNIEGFLSNEVKTVAFIPFAKYDEEDYSRKAISRFHLMGYRMEALVKGKDHEGILDSCDAVFIGGGNTFLLLKSLHEEGLIDPIRKRVGKGMPYIGTSAGSNVACDSIKTTNDMPIVYPPTFDALKLVPFNLNPHYMEPVPDSKHKGETREMRIEEFHQHNDNPVLGLRESAMLRVEGDSMTLLGSAGAKLFRRGRDPVDYGIGSDLSFLLKE